MQLMQNSLKNLTQSNICHSQISQSQQLLDSRLTNMQMQQMSLNILLQKLLQLHKGLDNTEKDNQFLRIQKAQLNHDLISIKEKAQNYLNSRVNQLNRVSYDKDSPQTKIIYRGRTTEESDQSRETPQLSQQTIEDGIQQNAKNKVLLKGNRNISNKLTPFQTNQPSVKKVYQSNMNSPAVKTPEAQTFNHLKGTKNGKYQLQFPKHKIQSLVRHAREFKQHEQQQKQTLQDFDSFYHHEQKPCQLSNYNRGTSMSKPSYKPRQQVIPSFQYSYQAKEQTDRSLNKSISSSNFRDGFKIPSSIQDIWNQNKKTSHQAHPMHPRLSYTNNQNTRLIKMAKANTNAFSNSNNLQNRNQNTFSNLNNMPFNNAYHANSNAFKKSYL